jgi:hypothetical protein
MSAFPLMSALPLLSRDYQRLGDAAKQLRQAVEQALESYPEPNASAVHSALRAFREAAIDAGESDLLMNFVHYVPHEGNRQPLDDAGKLIRLMADAAQPADEKQVAAFLAKPRGILKCCLRQLNYAFPRLLASLRPAEGTGARGEPNSGRDAERPRSAATPPGTEQSEGNDDRGLPLTPQWRDNPGNFPRIPPVPDPIVCIPDPSLRQRATDAWLCAMRLYKIIDVWRDWFRQLETTGDADPGAAGRLDEAANVCIKTLFKLSADIPTFRGREPKDILAGLPRDPVYAYLPDSDSNRWQENKDFFRIERAKVNRLSGSFPKLQGELWEFMNALVIGPSAAFLNPGRDAERPRAAATPPEAEQGEGVGADGEPNEEELTDRQRLILETMLENEITGHRRRKNRADIVKLVNRTHNPAAYGRDFAVLVKHGYLKSVEGPKGGVCLTGQGKAEAQRLRQSK